MHIGYDNMKAEYIMDGVKLGHVNEKKDLGGKCGTGKYRTGKCETNDVKFEGPKMQYWKTWD